MPSHATGHACVCAALLLAAACTDDAPLAPRQGGGPAPPTGGGSLQLAAVRCTGDTRAGSLACEGPQTGAAHDLIVGGQNVYVRVSSANPSYDAGTQRFTFEVSLRNLIPQALGTLDGTTLHGNGVRIFFHAPPTATTGSGAITVVGDGTGTFTGTGQPYYQYNQVLSQYELSSAKQWRLDMPPEVLTFDFELYVNAPVQYPDGWVEVEPAVFSLRALQDRQVTATVKTAVGNPDPTAPVTWGTSDPGTATVSPTGLVSGVRAGSVAIQATSSLGRVGTSAFSITGIQRTWTGAADSDWSNPANWDPAGVLPAPVDTAVIPGDLVTYPVLTSNQGIGGVIMTPGTTVQPSIALGLFDFTLGASIDHGSSGRILGDGRMLFAGTAQAISGGPTNVDYRHARFLGRYSLNTNLNVTGGRIVVQGGRLRSTGHRIRVRPN